MTFVKYAGSINPSFQSKLAFPESRDSLEIKKIGSLFEDKNTSE